MGGFYAMATLTGLTILLGLLGKQTNFVVVGSVYGVTALAAGILFLIGDRLVGPGRVYYISLFVGCVIVSIGLLA